jgi:hypothetical protein
MGHEGPLRSSGVSSTHALPRGSAGVARATERPPAMFMVSFTGLAQIAPPMDTGEWLMRTLWAHKNEELFESLARVAGKAIAAIAIPRALKRHAFLVSGWLQHGEWAVDGPLPCGFKPGAYATLLSNFHASSAPGGQPCEPELDFRHSMRVLLPDQKFAIDSVGAQLAETERDSLDRHVTARLESERRPEDLVGAELRRFRDSGQRQAEGGRDPGRHRHANAEGRHHLHPSLRLARFAASSSDAGSRKTPAWLHTHWQGHFPLRHVIPSTVLVTRGELPRVAVVLDCLCQGRADDVLTLTLGMVVKADGGSQCPHGRPGEACDPGRTAGSTRRELCS